jgi:hypothetical protein
VSLHQLAAKQVLAVYQGSVEISIQNQPPLGVELDLTATKLVANGSIEGNDCYAMPADVWRSYRNAGSSEVVMLVMTPGDDRKRITWAPNVIERAAAAGYTHDANGYVGLKRFIDRSQR